MIFWHGESSAFIWPDNKLQQKCSLHGSLYSHYNLSLKILQFNTSAGNWVTAYHAICSRNWKDTIHMRNFQHASWSSRLHLNTSCNWQSYVAKYEAYWCIVGKDFHTVDFESQYSTSSSPSYWYRSWMYTSTRISV